MPATAAAQESGEQIRDCSAQPNRIAGCAEWKPWSASLTSNLAPWQGIEADHFVV